VTTNHPSHPDQLMARALGVCWHPPGLSAMWACTPLEGRCDACETPGIFPLCCADHQARMCISCDMANHGGEA
jgi:hypothetical protein